MLAKEVFKEFIVRDEPHPIAQSSSEFFRDAWRTLFKFPNGVAVSVVQGEMFYTDQDHPYEAYIIDGKLKGWDGDPYGYLDDFDLIGFLYRIKEQGIGETHGTK